MQRARWLITAKAEVIVNARQQRNWNAQNIEQ
jgi:hypothetical protein